VHCDREKIPYVAFSNVSCLSFLLPIPSLSESSSAR